MKQLITLTLGMALAVGSGCKSSNSDDEQLILLLTAAVIIVGPQGNGTYLSRAQAGLAAWEIGLATGITSYLRFLGNSSTAHNPANWITTSDSTCTARGVPAEMISSCALTGSTIGVCQTRFLPTGQIVDSTAIMRQDYQDSASESEARSVFTHEIGHCLGLRHSNDTALPSPEQYVMFSSSAGADTPHASEKASVASAYTPTIQSPTTESTRWNATGSNVIRHFSFPVFTISYNVGNAMTAEQGEFQSQAAPRGKDYGVPLMVRNVYFNADGTEWEEVYLAGTR